MARNRYSKKLKAYSGELPIKIQYSIQDIKTMLNKRKLDILEWDKNSIAISVVLNVQLPPRGNYQDIDIREKEPVLIVFNKSSYPDKAPRAYSDRLDFPKKNLAHLYVSKEGKPVPFCLTRGNLDEWFAEKEIRDYVLQIRSWLCDAASGELASDSDQYEPLRLEGYYGSYIYKYKELADYVNNQCNKKKYAVGLFYEVQGFNKDIPISLKLLGIIEDSNDLSSILKKYQEYKDTNNIKKIMLGLVCWEEALSVKSDYVVNLPSNYQELIEFCSILDIDIDLIVKAFLSIKPEKGYIPIIVAIKRPKNIIGYNSDIEFVNFIFFISQDEIQNKEPKADSIVIFQEHIEPLSISKALEVSGSENNLGKLVIAGCGALGSKVIMHLMRSGHTNMVLFDNDELSAHNLVRHSLFPQQVGKNKAVAIKDIAEEFYKFDDLNNLIPISLNAELLIPPFLADANWFLDFTASKSFFNHQIKNINETSVNICKATILDNGNLGVLLIEGKNRSPRLDDLLVLFYDLYKQYPFIGKYLQNEYDRSRQESTIINVGVGCNSETTILSDEIVSIHSAAFYSVIKNEYERKSFKDNGYIFINRISADYGFKIESSAFVVPPIIAVAYNGWEIRMKPEIAIKMKSEMGIAMPYETGGVFIGTINKKNRTIHVTDMIAAPSDSESNEITFCRGINNLPEDIDKIKRMSGQVFGYIGEWHSHPFGPNGLSPQDMREVNKHLKEFRSLTNPIPLFMMLVTPSGLIPFVFE